MKLLVTGGAGFIGSHLVRFLLAKPEVESVINLDWLTYAGDTENVRDCDKDPKYFLEKANLRDHGKLVSVCRQYQFTHVVHLAAESHVDRSIADPEAFLKTNVIGTHNLLKALQLSRQNLEKFVYVSTDEVYGSIEIGASNEQDPLCPSSPYSASKAAAEMLVMAEGRTFGLPWCITRGANTYGTHQYPEKLLPVVVKSVMAGIPIPIYGNGMNVREWMHVDDHCAGIWEVLKQGYVGHIWNIGSGHLLTNIQFAREIQNAITSADGKPRPSNLEMVSDRRGHDVRYHVSTDKIRKYLDWVPLRLFDLSDVVPWYMEKFKVT